MRPTADRVRELVAKGLSDRKMAKVLGCPFGMIQRIRRANGILPGCWGRTAREGSRRWAERYGLSYTPEPGVKVASEAAWAAALAGARFSDDPKAPPSAGLLRLPAPAGWSTGESSMSWAG